jgi:hypothetical protein
MLRSQDDTVHIEPSEKQSLEEFKAVSMKEELSARFKIYGNEHVCNNVQELR